MTQMVKRQDGLVKHQNGVIHSEVVSPCIGNIFDRANHVVAEVADGAASEWRKTRNLHRFELRHRLAKVLDELFAGTVFSAATHDEKRITAQERIACYR